MPGRFGRLAAGDLRERIFFVSEQVTSDNGFTTSTWSSAFAAWAAQLVGTGVNDFTQDRRGAKIDVDFEVRYRADITPDMRVVWRGRIFEIISLSPDPIFGRLVVRCIEESNLAIDRLTVSPSSPLLVAVGSTQQMTATVFDTDGDVFTAFPVSWASSNPTIASVSSSGLLTAVAVGSVVITVLAGGKLATVAVTVGQTTFQALLLAFNALGAGGQGMTASVAWLVGLGPAYQTITADGASSTGFYCSKIENALNPGDGNHQRPVPSLHSGKGAECTVDGKIVSDGLYCPGTGPFLSAPGWQDDPTTLASIAGLVPNALLSDRSKGFTVITLAKLRVNSSAWRLGATGDPNLMRFGGDDINNPGGEPMRDPNSGFGSYNLLGQGSLPVVCSTHVRHMSDTTYASLAGLTGNNFRFNRYTRDVIQDLGTGIGIDQYAAGRDLYFIDFNGLAPGADTTGYGLVIGAGMENQAQTSLFHDWVEAQPWASGFWKDTRSLGFLFGDSFQEPLKSLQTDGVDHIGHIVRGFKGRPRLPNFTICDLARAGNTPATFQYPFKHLLENCDFVRRPKLVSMQWEILNGATVQNNYDWADEMRTFLGAKGKVIGYDFTYNTNVNKPLNEPGVYNELVAHGLAHYDAIIHVHDGMMYSDFNFGDGFSTQRPEWWVSQHPKEPDMQEYLEGFYYCGFALGLGVDLSNQSMKVDPNVDHVAVVVGGGTVTPTWTPRRYDTAALAGKTLAFTSRNAGMASVDGAGAITAHANGDVAIDCWTNDGAKGTVIAQVSGGVYLLHTFTAADSSTAVPAADTGQAAIVENDGVWGISGNQLYRATQGIGAGHDKVVFDAGVATGTFTVTLATIAQQMGIVWRDSDEGDGFGALIDTGGNTLGVFRRQAGVDTPIDHGILHTWVNGDAVGVILPNDGSNHHQITINGVVVDTITDAFNNTATRFGAMQIGGTTGGRWDNVRVA